jgi:hypothetical protein
MSSEHADPIMNRPSRSVLPKAARQGALKVVRPAIRTALWLAAAASVFVLIRGLFFDEGPAYVIIAALLVLWYFGSAVVGGTLFGLLDRFRTSPIRSAAVGVVSALVPYLLLAWAVGRAPSVAFSTSETLLTAVVGALVFGVPYGLAHWPRDEQ